MCLFLILGGTVDITVHKVQHDKTLKELFKANGGPWGSTTVDQAFLNFLEDILGTAVMTKLKNEHKDVLIDMMRDFEVKKRTIDPELSSNVTLNLPITVHELYREINNSEIRESLQKNPKIRDKLTFAGDKLSVEPDVMKGLYLETCNSIVNHLREIFKEPMVKGTETILMVGGFSESSMIHYAIENNFPDVRVIVPQEAGLAVLKGAVIFGHNDQVITSRISRYTYGIKMYETFIPGIHPECKMIIDGYGKPMVQGAFSKLVECDQPVSHDDNYEGITCVPHGPGSTNFTIELFATSKKDPQCVDDPDCISIGEVEIDGRDEHGTISEVSVSIVFGGTELEVRAVNSDTGELTSANFNFLD